jgi:hypothetical protein
MNKTKKHSKQYTKQHIKRHTIIHRQQHNYYIVRCYNKEYELDNKYLEQYLQKLGLVPDNKSMNIIASMYKKTAARNKVPLSSICDTTMKLPKFDKKILKADVFFLNDIHPYPNQMFNYYPKYFVNKVDYSMIDKTINKFDVLSVITKYNPKLAKYCPPTFKLNELDKYEFPKWYILRPLDSYSGVDIFYINNQTDLSKYIEYYKKTKNYRNVVYGNEVAASEYISNPLLFNKRKCHLRLYMLISISSNTGDTRDTGKNNFIFNSFLLHYGKILTAKEPFDMLEPFSKAKHDTHFKSTDKDYRFPKDFTSENLNVPITEKDKDVLWNKIIDIMKPIAKEMEKNKNELIYSDVKNCYYILGIDMMVRDNLDPAFIEINYRPGVGFKKDSERDAFTKLYTDWTYETVLEPLFKYNNPLKARTHPTYLAI